MASRVEENGINVLAGKLQHLGETKVTRREFLKAAARTAVGVGVPTLVAAALTTSQRTEASSAEVAAGPVPSGKDVPAILVEPSSLGGFPESLPPKASYTNEEIENAVMSEGVAPGANAIMVDPTISEFGIPVHILATIGGNGKTDVEFERNGKIIKAQTSPENLKLPTAPLRNWIPANTNQVPNDSLIIATMKEVDIGVDWINRFYEQNGVKDRVLPVENTNINWAQGESEPRTNIICDETTAFCTSNQPLMSLLMFENAAVNDANGRILDIDGTMFLYSNYQSPEAKTGQLANELHEQTHTSQIMAGKYKEYYTTNKYLNEALETYTWAVALMALRQYRGQSPALAVVIDKYYYYPANTNLMWFNKIVQDLNVKGKDGLREILTYGAGGDMIGLRDLYNELYGKGKLERLYFDLQQSQSQ